MHWSTKKTNTCAGVCRKLYTFIPMTFYGIIMFQQHSVRSLLQNSWGHQWGKLKSNSSRMENWYAAEHILIKAVFAEHHSVVASVSSN